MDNQLKPYILLVEDLKIAAMAASFVLKNASCLVDVAETGASVLKLINQKKYNLILMDIGLPDTDGVAVTEKIKENENLKDIPVIALTAHDKEDLKQRCFKVGMVDFLVKPLTAENVDNILKIYLEK